MPLIVDPVRLCLENGMYPEVLRNSRVTILPKKNQGIRPLAISETLNSVLEKVIIGSLNKFIEGIQGYPDEQSGFRKNMSCATALFQILKSYESNVGKNKVMALVLLDAKNAFGSLSHKSLMVVLRKYFQGRALRILEQSLLRFYVVNTRGFYSSLRKGTPHGVPQGGCLSPALFVLYISQIANLPFLDESRKLICFADDTALCISANTYPELVTKTNEAIKLLEEALTALGLILVPTKTHLITFGKSRHMNYGKNCRFNMSGETVIPVSKAKYLGTIVESIKGKLVFDSDDKERLGKFKGINSKASCISHSLSFDSNATILRACSVGTYQHNLAVLPPLSNVEIAKLHRTYDVGLRLPNNRRFKKFKKNAAQKAGYRRLGLPASTYNRITNHLVRLKQRSFNNIKIRSTVCNISSVFQSGKSISQCNFLCEHISLSIPGQNKAILTGIPYLNRTKNILARNLGLISINSSKNCVSVSGADFLSLFSELLLLELIRNEIIDFEITPGAVINTASARNRLWPLFASDWIVELPISVRKLILLPEGSPRLKRFFKEIHVHLELSVYCRTCRPKWEPKHSQLVTGNDISKVISATKITFEKLCAEMKQTSTIGSPPIAIEHWLNSHEPNIKLDSLVKFLISLIRG